MKHLFNNLSEEEKNRILEQHEGGKKIVIENFNKLVENKLGDVKPLISEQSVSDSGEKFTKEFSKYNKSIEFPNLTHVYNMCSTSNSAGCTRDGLYSNFDKKYDYKLSNGVWYAKRKEGNKWIDLTNHPDKSIREKSLTILNNKLAELKQGKKTTDKQKSSERGSILPSLEKTGFKVDRTSFNKNLGYFVNKCTQVGCAEYTYDMIGNVFGDAWQAYAKFKKYANVSPNLVKVMTDTFNAINKNGMPTLNDSTPYDDQAKEIIKSIVPSNQSQFNSLPLGTVVGLYYPDSSNFDLAFFQSAVGMSRDNEGSWVQMNKPYFCKKGDDCDQTLWSQKDVHKNVKFVPNDTLKGGKSFIPNTHIGFIGYIDDKGERYVIHNVHQKVYAYPVSKMNKDSLSIIWTGSPKVK